MKKNSTKPNQPNRATQVLPLSALTITTLEARLYLEENVPPIPPGMLQDPAIFAGFLRDSVIRPALTHLAFLGMSTDHEIVVRNAPWMREKPKSPRVPDDYRRLFQRPAGILVGSLLFRYLAALTDQSTNAHRSYLNAASGYSMVVDVDLARSSIQVYLPNTAAFAVGHAVATHFLLGKGVVRKN